MRNENHHHHHQFYHRNKNTFLPILCSRPSIKDVTLPRCNRGLPSSSSNDPLSPRIGCMGQVKRNNKIAGFPTSSSHYRLSFNSTTSRNSSNTVSPVVKYSKLKSLFSGKNLISITPSTTTTAASAGTSCGTRQQRVVVGPRNQIRCSSSSSRKEKDLLLVAANAINIDDLDPPLPVIKKRVTPKLEEGKNQMVDNSLWKRRSGGGPPLKSLQLQQQQIHHPNICTLQPPTVWYQMRQIQSLVFFFFCFFYLPFFSSDFYIHQI